MFLTGGGLQVRLVLNTTPACNKGGRAEKKFSDKFDAFNRFSENPPTLQPKANGHEGKEQSLQPSFQPNL
eukprot:5375623-Amphidinium_carterae.1